MLYAYISNTEVIGCGQLQMTTLGIVNLVITQSEYDNILRDKEYFIFSSGKLIKNPNYNKILENRKKMMRKSEILNLLESLDKKRIRAFCEDTIKDYQTNESWLDFYNNEILNLRMELKSLI